MVDAAGTDGAKQVNIVDADGVEQDSNTGEAKVVDASASGVEQVNAVDEDLIKQVDRVKQGLSKRNYYNTKRQVDVTSTMFVPCSRGSVLFKLISEKEAKLSKPFDWSVKYWNKQAFHC